MKIAATVSGCAQIGVDSFQDIRTTRVFEDTRPVRDILAWASSELGRPVHSICDVQLSDYTGESQ